MNKKNKTNWLELIIKSNADHLDIFSALFQNYSLGSVFNKDTISIFFKDNVKQNIQKKLVNYDKKFNFSWSWKNIENKNWHLAWMDRFSPIKIGSRITIVPSWDQQIYSEINVKIEPGRAFGTGHHQTTFLAIEFLEKLVSNSSKVLDLGTGSGILSIVSKFLGAKKIDALEIDLDCVDNFHINIHINKMENQINFIKCDVLKWKKFNYDIIVANINRNVILKLIPNLTKIKSKIILTGLLVNDETLITNECIKNKMKINKVKIKDEWIAMEIENV